MNLVPDAPQMQTPMEIQCTLKTYFAQTRMDNRSHPRTDRTLVNPMPKLPLKIRTPIWALRLHHDFLSKEAITLFLLVSFTMGGMQVHRLGLGWV